MKNDLDNPKICAVVVTYNRQALLKECLDSLTKQNGLNGIVIVNNASTDSTQEYLDSIKSDCIHVLHLPENTGGAGGFHHGLAHSISLGYDYSWIMDDDAIPTATALEALVCAANKIKWNFGFLTSSVISDTSEQMNTPVVDLRPNSTGYADWARYADIGLIKVRLATFVSVFVSNDIIKTVGLPIKEMFIWGDDSEFTQRISNRYESYLIPQSKVIHKRVLKNSLSIVREESPIRLSWFYLMYRNNGYRIRCYE